MMEDTIWCIQSGEDGRLKMEGFEIEA